MPDDLTSFLARVREDAGQESITHDAEDCADWRNSCSAHNAMRLAGMVEAVLKPHQPGHNVVFGSVCKRHENHPHFSITAREADDVRACPDCTATVYASCTGCGPGVSVDACVTRLTITRALNGDTDG